MVEKFDIHTQTQPTFYFIGVTTSKSSIMKVFPEWMKVLGRPEIQIVGRDLKIHDEAAAYRHAVAQIKYDPLSLGALVTTHKIDLYNAARDMFEYLDPYAQICGELSSISKLDGRLEGHAKDPITAGLSADAILAPGYFGRTGGVSEANVKDWFAAGAVAVGAGSELCPPALAKEGKFDEITARSAAFVKIVQEHLPVRN